MHDDSSIYDHWSMMFDLNNIICPLSSPYWTNTSKIKQSVVEMELILESPEPIPFLQHNKDCLQLETYKSFLNGGF